MGSAEGAVKPVDQCRGLEDVLEQIRLRPSMWVSGGSLRELQTILLGYGVALSVHGVNERFDLGPGGPFAEWLLAGHGWSMSTGWASAIERHADGEEPLMVFFRLLDEYRANQRDL